MRLIKISAGDLCLLTHRHATAPLRICRVRDAWNVADGVTAWTIDVQLNGEYYMRDIVLERDLIPLAPYSVVWDEAELAVAKWIAVKMGMSQA